MFTVTEKTVTRFIVNDTEFETKKEARRHAAWLQLEQNLTDHGYRDMESFLKFNPAEAVDYLLDYQKQIQTINLPENPFRYDNIQWGALKIYRSSCDDYLRFTSWADVADALQHFANDGEKINAIKLVRVTFGAGLVESKNWVEDRWTSRDFTAV